MDLITTRTPGDGRVVALPTVALRCSAAHPGGEDERRHPAEYHDRLDGRTARSFALRYEPPPDELFLFDGHSLPCTEYLEASYEQREGAGDDRYKVHYGAWIRRFAKYISYIYA